MRIADRFVSFAALALLVIPPSWKNRWIATQA